MFTKKEMNQIMKDVEKETYLMKEKSCLENKLRNIENTLLNLSEERVKMIEELDALRFHDSFVDTKMIIRNKIESELKDNH